MDESLDVPILEEQSSCPMELLQEQWLVGTDIENIERYADGRGRALIPAFFSRCSQPTASLWRFFFPTET